jgi:lysine-N-methylase
MRGYGWGVLVDRITYEKYQDPGAPLVAGRTLATLVDISPNKSSAGDYARIHLEGSRCPVFTEGLCAIHRDLGEPWLPDLCSTFPRVLTVTGGVLERSLHLSCPEAARLVLTDPQAMAIGEHDGDGQPYREGSVSLLGNDSPNDHLQRVRALVIEVIRERSRPLWQRIVSLGFAIDRLANVEMPQAAAVMEDHLRELKDGSLDDLLNSQRGNAILQLETALELIVARLGADYTAQRFLDCYREFMVGLNWTAHSSMEELADRYQHASRTWFLPFVSRHEHVLENYLINYVFRTLFPYRRKLPDQRVAIDSDRESMKLAFLVLGVHYALIRALLIGAAAFHRENLTIDHVVKVIQSYAKAFLHSGTFEGLASELLDKDAGDLTRKVALLIMD